MRSYRPSNDQEAGAICAIRILLVDGQAMVREGLRLIISSEPDFEVIGEAGNRAEALEIALSSLPDLILVDPDLDAGSDYAIIAELRAVSENAKVIILSGSRSPEIQRIAIARGARGVVWKWEASEILFKAIRKVTAGELWLQRSVAASLLLDLLSTGQSSAPEAAVAKLTQREREVLSLVAEGLRNKQIADRLFVTESTVSHHLTSIFSKLGISDRLQLIVYAHRQGLIRNSQEP